MPTDLPLSAKDLDNLSRGADILIVRLAGPLIAQARAAWRVPDLEREIERINQRRSDLEHKSIAYMEQRIVDRERDNAALEQEVARLRGLVLVSYAHYVAFTETADAYYECRLCGSDWGSFSVVKGEREAEWHITDCPVPPLQEAERVAKLREGQEGT